MKVKKFFAASLKEALEQIKIELGDEAVILSTKSIDGDNRFGTKACFEVVAGLDDNSKERESVSKTPKIRSSDPSFSEEDLLGLKEKIFKEKKQFSPHLKEKKNEERDTREKFTREIEEIKKMLIANDVKNSIVEYVLKQIRKQSDLIKKGELDDFVLASLSSLINTEGFEVNNNTKPKTVALVGPTGVGKTTCVAKLALISKILHKLDVGLITIDTFRLGALDQIKIFSELSKIELLVAYEPSELKKLAKKFSKKDLIFIDTVGRSQANQTHLQDIKKMLDTVEIDETFLVMNTVGSTKNLLDVGKKFNILNYSGLIFSKIDESVSYGNILNVSYDLNKPIKFLTNGQVIPDDIIAADADNIAKMIYSGVGA